mgnify:CR=1
MFKLKTFLIIALVLIVLYFLGYFITFEPFGIGSDYCPRTCPKGQLCPAEIVTCARVYGGIIEDVAGWAFLIYIATFAFNLILRLAKKIAHKIKSQ